LLPADFDRRHFNAAPADLVAAGYLRGDEPVVVTGATPRGTLSFMLPAQSPPGVRVVLRGASEQRLTVAANLDTVIVEPDQLRVLLLWRAHIVLRTGPHDLAAIEVSAEAPLR
jgi:hypothetical protein